MSIEVDFLSHIVGTDEPSTDAAKIITVWDWYKHTRLWFLDFHLYYQQSMANFSRKLTITCYHRHVLNEVRASTDVTRTPKLLYSKQQDCKLSIIFLDIKDQQC